MRRVFVAGDVTYNSLIYLDQFPQPQPQTVFSSGFYETVGGTAAGKALNLCRLGLDVTLHGLVGEDQPGEHVRAYFARQPLTFLYDTDPRGTQRHINLMDQAGQRISIYAAYATFDPIIDLPRLEARIAQSDSVVINLSNYCRRLIPAARQHGKPIWCDIHDYDGADTYHQAFIDAADVMLMSSDRMPDYRPFMQRQIAAGRQLVVCSHGRDGSTALTREGQWIQTPALTDYPTRDTNGAGDSFFAGILYGCAHGYPIQTCLRLGTVAAGLCVTSSELYAPELSEAHLLEDYRQHYGGSA